MKIITSSLVLFFFFCAVSNRSTSFVSAGTTAAAASAAADATAIDDAIETNESTTSRIHQLRGADGVVPKLRQELLVSQQQQQQQQLREHKQEQDNLNSLNDTLLQIGTGSVLTKCTTSCLYNRYCIPENDDCTQYGREPVCACNGIAYAKQCSAYNQGVNVRHKGPCPDPAPVTTSSSDDDHHHHFLHQPTQQEQESQEQTHDHDEPWIVVTQKNKDVMDTSSNNACTTSCYLSPTCTPTWEFCGNVELKLVCGCDGREYVSSCEAFNKGVNVAHVGHCLEN